MKFFIKVNNVSREIKDSDADGLLDEEEKKLGTNPKKKDSDSDGLNDYEEVKVYGTDPNNPDTDKDGVLDGEEVKRGRNPRGPGKLKDLFIPCAGNDYKPQALHPRRVFFYAASAVLIKVLVIGFIITIPIGAWLTPDVFLEQGKKIIDLTNKIRQSSGVPLLTENNLLTRAAYNKAEDMLLYQYFAHVGPDKKTISDWLASVNYKYAVAGENLAMGFSGAEEVVNGWVKSQTHYANIIDPDFSEIGVGVSSGLYNNYDTTLVAQFFGSSQLAVFVANTEKNNLTEVLAENVREGESEEKMAVRGEKEGAGLPSLEPPVLIYPAKGFLTSQSLIKTKIFAPQAEEIIIFDNGAEIARSQEIKNGFIELEINLTEGEHNLEITSVQGEEEAKSGNYSLTVDKTAPAVDEARTKLTVIEPAGQEEKIVRAVAYLSSDAVSAEVIFSNYRITLTPAPEEEGKWVGQAIIFNQDEEQIFNPVILANLIARDKAGNEMTVDVGWENITPVKPSLLSQYFFLKGEQPKYVKALFDVSSVYYKILLSIVIIALFLNIFIEIKKQHPKIIASALGLIFLLVFLIIL
ncbi:MAG: CAP domain-containing protein [Patescibacteria group bacterium]|nr:CAP domain-containing protein [Patescibacteria group bacterium]